MLSRKQRNEFRRAGFTDAELGALNESLRDRPQVFDISDPAWQQVLAMRKIWIQKQLDAGELRGNINHKINMWLWQSKERNPIWGLLRAEYARIFGHKLKDFQRAYVKKDRKVRDSLYRKPRRKRTYEQVRGRE